MAASEFEHKGLYGRDYHHARLTKHTVECSLQQRIKAVRNCIQEVGSLDRIRTVLDVGSADGLLAGGIISFIHGTDRIYALDRDKQLLGFNPFTSINADCTRMPFCDDSFDVIIAAAVIEHLPSPTEFLHECKRILRKGGLLVLTCPAPFFDWVATKIGYLKDAGHLARYSLKDLKRLCSEAGFEVVFSKKFMISPVRFPGAIRMESLLSQAGLDLFMLNQIIGAMVPLD